MKYTVEPGFSINEALGKCVPGDTVFIKKGIYKEKIEILTDHVRIIGESREDTVITNHDFYHKIMADYNECNTFRTYTCYVGASHVRLSDLTIENSCVPSSTYGQAVALHVDGDDFLCEGVILRGAQDTLFTGPLPKDLIQRHQGFLRQPFLKEVPSVQVYKDCTIRGDVDFIFGGATALFENCDIVSINRTDTASSGPKGYICAPSHSEALPYGYLFYRCRLLKEGNAENVFLARPWRDYGCAAFIECIMDTHISPLGFNKWGNTDRDKTARFYEYTENTDLTQREPWAHELTSAEALEYVRGFYGFIHREAD